MFTKYVLPVFVFLRKKLTVGKVILLASGLTSSSFVGVWMFATMPLGMPVALGLIVSIVAAIVLDAIITYTAFSKNQGKWNWLTSVASLTGGIAVTIALFGGYHWFFLHIIFIVMGFLFSRFVASEHTGTELVSFDTPETKEILISKLISAGLDNESIYGIVKGNRAKTLDMIKRMREDT